MVAEHLQEIVSEERIDLVIANAENAAGGFGITPLVADELLSFGLDVLTSGNHIWDKREIHDYLARQPRLLRPANYLEELPGSGLLVVDKDQLVGIISLKDMMKFLSLKVELGDKSNGKDNGGLN